MKKAGPPLRRRRPSKPVAWNAQTSDLYIVNKGRNDIADLMAATPDATWRLGDLPAGRMIRFSQHLEG